MKAAFKGKYDIDNNGGAAATMAVNAGDVKLRASITDATFINGPSLTGLALAVEKPGSFILDYNVPKKDFRFQFMNTVRVAEKPLNFTYMHSRGDNRTILDGTLVLDTANKVSANYASYQTSSKVLGFEWSRNSKQTGCFKVVASVNLAEEMKLPKLSAETTWNFEM
ncbi:outer envelope pore protein 24, chloroplastic-like isoform X2 [Gastrolobium bilobum]|uniref:outer envelope pore protein 24, chloroplastic-like isoform X2 n=1 Tax=Gastrolobium bilobum TaxID=150636 RepID=UPI002AB0B4A4|nr:outer envelope pore protein 24, chloroplastic-like isoform X2 [Gastrolobium bilobum]